MELSECNNFIRLDLEELNRKELLEIINLILCNITESNTTLTIITDSPTMAKRNSALRCVPLLEIMDSVMLYTDTLYLSTECYDKLLEKAKENKSLYTIDLSMEHPNVRRTLNKLYSLS